MILRSVAVAGLLMAVGVVAQGQQGDISPAAQACGVASAKFNVTVDHVPSMGSDVPEGKAAVYVIESLPDYPFVSKTVNIGMDGNWLGATTANSHMEFFVTPGVHHLCAEYEGKLAEMDAAGRVLLLRLNAKAGQTYYISYHGVFLKDTYSIAFFDFANVDEGELLVGETRHVSSTPKQ